MKQADQKMPSRFDLSTLNDLESDEGKALLQKASHQFRKSGVLWLEGIFDKNFIKELENVFTQEYSGLNKKQLDETCLDVGLEDRYMYSVELKPPFNNPQLYLSPLLLPLLKTVLCEDLIIQSIGAICSFPGAEKQHLHADHAVLFPGPLGFNQLLPAFAATVAIPLCDFDEEKGTTAFWEGSHRDDDVLPDKKDFDYAGTFQPMPKVGDCFLWDFRVRHSGMPNKSTSMRPMLHFVISRPWFEDRANYGKKRQYPLVSKQKHYDELSPELLKLFPGMRIIPD